MNWGYHAAADLHAAGADVVVNDFAQLLPALDMRWGGTVFPSFPQGKRKKKRRGKTMRDIFEEIFESERLDPTEAARANMRPLRKRFYKQATVDANNAILLDGKPVRTPARRSLAAPGVAIAQAIADEWNAQGEMIDRRRCR